MTTVRPLKMIVIAVALLVVVLAGVALASAPLPKTAKAYSTGGIRRKVGVTLVTNASNPKVIQPGVAAAGSQFALSGGAVLCPKAKKNKGFHEIPFAVFGFPGATLKILNGKYGFSKTERMSEVSALGSSAKPFKLKVKIVGSVVSPTTIKGAVTAKGGPCTSKKPLSFTAKLDPKIPVAPGE